MMDIGSVRQGDWWGYVPTVGELIRARRLELKMTQERLAELLDRAQHYISEVETGKIRQPSRETLEDFAAALRLSYADLMRAAGYIVEVSEPREASFAWGPAVPYFGVVPADTVRWVAMETEGSTVPAPRQWIGTRSPQDFLVVTASGNCLSRRGIISGTRVLLRRYQGEALANGTVVLVRVQGEHSLKEFFVRAGAVELRTAEGEVVTRLASDDEYAIVGVYVGHWMLGTEGNG